MELPLICNRCGACCRRGGHCIVRGWEAANPFRSLDFQGRCELLVDEQDGSTFCVLLALASEDERDGWIDGICDFPEVRQEIG